MLRCRVIIVLVCLICFTIVAAQQSHFRSIPGNQTVYRFDPLIKRNPLRIPSRFSNLDLSHNNPNARSSDDCSLSADIRVTYTGFTPQAQAAFQYAVDIWKRCIVATIPIRIDVAFNSLGPSTLGQAIVARYIIDESGND
ncbi:MAG: hypothetical protein HKN76_19975 [Saprospiraceae bacterium]|nr:hypothetical protein [Saprospiraceae bacterium]